MAKVIGIDPGKHTGMAIAMDGKITALTETDFWGCVDYLQVHDDALVVIELPNTKHVWHGDAKAKGAIQRTGVNVGSCIREAELLVSWLHRNKRNYIIQKPQGKLDANMFKRITGWSGPTNQHKRDAGMLAVGLSAKKPRQWVEL